MRGGRGGGSGGYICVLVSIVVCIYRYTELLYSFIYVTIHQMYIRAFKCYAISCHIRICIEMVQSEACTEVLPQHPTCSVCISTEHSYNHNHHYYN